MPNLYLIQANFDHGLNPVYLYVGETKEDARNYLDNWLIDEPREVNIKQVRNVGDYNVTLSKREEPEPKLFIAYAMVGDCQVIDATTVVASSKAEAEDKAMKGFSEMGVPCYADAFELKVVSGYKVNLSKEE